MTVEINSVIIGGNLARDVVLKEVGTGKKVASFVVASNRTFMMGGEKKKETAFVDVDVWGQMAENCSKYLKKGSPVVVTGRLKQDQWTTETGEKRSRLKIVAGNVQFLPSSQQKAAAQDPAAAMEATAWEE
ncbi:MAG: single-stranded DNA-binding protein [Candidatus Omnitrophota bacterium]|jgi:single-strand DNA-binding protein